MASALADQFGPQPDFQRMSGAIRTFNDELDKLPNMPQFDAGRAILEAIKNLGTELNAKVTELNAKGTELNTKVTELNTKFDGLKDQMRIKYISLNYLSLSILTNPVTKTLQPVFKIPIFRA